MGLYTRFVFAPSFLLLFTELATISA